MIAISIQAIFSWTCFSRDSQEWVVDAFCCLRSFQLQVEAGAAAPNLNNLPGQNVKTKTGRRCEAADIWDTVHYQLDDVGDILRSACVFGSPCLKGQKQKVTAFCA